MQRHIALATTILFTAGLASADKTFESFETADTNDNGNISKDEFYGLVSDAGTYADWDYDADGLIDENEYDDIGVDGDFDTWDANNDSYLDSGEFYDGYFTSFDANNDDYWDDTEWDDAGETGVFDV